jgi:putative ABC transport system permease protein
MAVGLLVIMMLSEQKNYDNFHPDSDRIYRIISGRSFAFNQNATVPMPLANVITEYDKSLEIVQLIRAVGGDVVYNNNSQQLAGYFAGSSFFEVFGFELQQGNPETCLDNPQSVVLTTEAATRLFGTDDPLGKDVRINDRGIFPSGFDSKIQKPVAYGEFTVTGIIKNPPNKSHLQYDMLVSDKTIFSLENQGIRSFPLDDWDNYYTCYTYMKVGEAFDAPLFQSYLDRLSEQNYTGDEVYKVLFELQPLAEITPGKLLNYAPSLRMPGTLYYVFAALVLFIIIIASFNYTSITVARSMVRAKEIGIRKVSGATRNNLVIQFLIESVTIAIISSVVAVLLLVALKPAFMGLHINQYLNYDLEENFHFIIYGSLLVISVGVMAGIFPGYFLSGLHPASIMKTTILLKPSHVPLLKNMSLYKTLVIIQFFFSFIFIVSTMLMSKQLKHYFQMETGFDKEAILILDLQGHDYDEIASKFRSYAGISGVAGSDMVLSVDFPETNYMVSLHENGENGFTFPCINITENFLDMYKIGIIAGMNPEQLREKQSEHDVLINMYGVQKLGFESPVEIIGSTLNIGGEIVKVIGVTDNFQNCMPLAQSEQLLMRFKPDECRYLSIKMANEDKQTTEFIQNTWKSIDPVHEVNFDLLSDKMKASVAIFQDVRSIIAFITTINIFISCFGLLGITAFITERRLKEIGIRKVLGANIFQLHRHLSKSFINLILISSFIAAPFAFFMNGMWLNRLANKVVFGFDTMIWGILIILLLGIVTISIQVLRISFINPVKILHDE